MVEELTGEELQDTAERASASPWRALSALGRVLVLPRSTFTRVAAENVTVWPAAVGLVIAAGVLKSALGLAIAMRSGQLARALPAFAVRYGADLLAPVAFAFAAAGALVLVQRLWQGDASFSRLLSAVSLALTPLALRDLIQAAYMAFTRTVLMHPGLSALLAPPPRSIAGRLGYALLGQADAFMLWVLVLLTLAVTVTHGRGWIRPVFATLGIAVIATLIGAVPSLAFAMLLFR